MGSNDGFVIQEYIDTHTHAYVFNISFPKLKMNLPNAFLSNTCLHHSKRPSRKDTKFNAKLEIDILETLGHLEICF